MHTHTWKWNKIRGVPISVSQWSLPPVRRNYCEDAFTMTPCTQIGKSSTEPINGCLHTHLHYPLEPGQLQSYRPFFSIVPATDCHSQTQGASKVEHSYRNRSTTMICPASLCNRHFTSAMHSCNTLNHDSHTMFARSASTGLCGYVSAKQPQLLSTSTPTNRDNAHQSTRTTHEQWSLLHPPFSSHTCSVPWEILATSSLNPAVLEVLRDALLPVPSLSIFGYALARAPSTPLMHFTVSPFLWQSSVLANGIESLQHKGGGR